jgi:hypothetical protein
MSSSPRVTIDDSYTVGLSCAICGSPELFVQHLPNYPDFVTCSQCGSAFVVEDGGERVLYGNIASDYPRTAEFALKQWVWLEAVERRAAEERPTPPSEEPVASMRSSDLPAQVEAEPAEAEPQEEPDLDWLESRLKSGGMPAGVPIPTEPEPFHPEARQVPLSSDTGPTEDSLPAWLREEEPARAAPPPAPSTPARLRSIAAPPEAPPSPARVEPASPAAAPASAKEPPPGQRYRVVVRGDRVLMPVNACAHCRRTPAPDRLPIPGSLPRPGSPGQRRPTTFQVPLCRDCSLRSRQRSAEQRGAALMGHLTGALVGLVLVVAALAANLLPFGSGLLVGLAATGGAWLAGYLVTAALLVPRARRAPPPEDAAYVLTTLRVSPESPIGQTAFEFRQRETALGFQQANGNAVTAGPTAVPEAAQGA